MQSLIKQIRAFNNERDWDQYHSPKNLTMALMVEAGELAEHFQWMTQEESLSIGESVKQQLREEIGDVFIYLITN